MILAHYYRALAKCNHPTPTPMGSSSGWVSRLQQAIQVLETNVPEMLREMQQGKSKSSVFHPAIEAKRMKAVISRVAYEIT